MTKGIISKFIHIFHYCLFNRFSLMFGGSEDLAGMCPHTLMREQLEDHLNHHKNLALLGKILNETYAPLKSLARLPTTPQVIAAFVLGTKYMIYFLNV
jgi:hypothetical protein